MREVLITLFTIAIALVGAVIVLRLAPEHTRPAPATTSEVR